MTLKGIATKKKKTALCIMCAAKSNKKCCCCIQTLSDFLILSSLEFSYMRYNRNVRSGNRIRDLEKTM